MPDSDLRITFGADASGVVQGAAQAKTALAGVVPSVRDLGRAFSEVADKSARGFKGLGEAVGGLAKAGGGVAEASAAIAQLSAFGVRPDGPALAAASKSGGAEARHDTPVEAEPAAPPASAPTPEDRLASQLTDDAIALGSTQWKLDQQLRLETDHIGQVGQAQAAGLAQQDAARRADLAKFQSEWDGAVKSLVPKFTRGLTQMAEGARTFGQVLKSLGQEMLDNFVSRMINPMLEQWLAKEAGQTAATIAGVGARSAASAAGAAKDATTTGAAALKDLMSSAAAAAGQAFKAMAGIPIVGPALGAAAAAAAFAGVMAFQGMIQSAEGGFDVPSGLNPLTLLHAREMVLPADLAERVRSFTGGGAAAPTINATFHAYGADAAAAVQQSQRQWRRHIENLARNNAMRAMSRT